jgi:uncharacterized protein (DUF1684 family)
VVVVAALAAACGAGQPDTSHYVEEVDRARAAKDRQFQTQQDSPVPAAKRASLLPLSYFPIDPDARVPAVLKRAEDQVQVEMPTSTGQRRPMFLIGRLQFTYKGTPLGLTAFSEEGRSENPRLFVAFTDLTTGTETYAAGRYLDVERSPAGIYTLDFNRAYHPYCYYDERYDCPYPPKENRLQVPIRAGERLPSGPQASGLGP